jgi:hypothetical protein
MQPYQLQNLRRRVIVMKQPALSGLANHLLEDRFDHASTVPDNLPLGRRRQRNTQTALEPLEAIQRKPASILQQCDHARRFGVVFVRSHAGGVRAVKICPHRLHRSFCNSYTVAPRGAWTLMRTKCPGSTLSYTVPFLQFGQASPPLSDSCGTRTLSAPVYMSVPLRPCPLASGTTRNPAHCIMLSSTLRFMLSSY